MPCPEQGTEKKSDLRCSRWWFSFHWIWIARKGALKKARRVCPTSNSSSLPFWQFPQSLNKSFSTPSAHPRRREWAHSPPTAHRLPVPPFLRPSTHGASFIHRGENQKHFLEPLGTGLGLPAVASHAGIHPAPECGRFAVFILNKLSLATERSL